MRGSCSSLVLKSSDDAPLQGASKYILCDHRGSTFFSRYRYVSPRVYRARAQAEPYLDSGRLDSHPSGPKVMKEDIVCEFWEIG